MIPSPDRLPTIDEQMSGLLRALAASRSPSTDEVSRVGVRVDDVFRAATTSPSRPIRRLSMRRTRTAVAVLLATLAFGVGSAAVSAAAMPGPPLYGARLTMEQVLLPAQPIAARSRAQLERLHRRLDEIDVAIADPDAVRDSAAAYRATLEDIVSIVRGDPAEARSVVHELAIEEMRLEDLESKAPSPTDAAISAALTETRDLLGLIRPPRPMSVRRSGRPER